MGPVSGQLRRWISEALHGWSTCRPGLASLCRELDEQPETPLSWEAFAALCSRLEPLLGGREAFVEAVRDFASNRIEAGRHESLGFSDERQTYWFASQALGPALLPELDFTFDAPDASRVHIGVSIPEDAPDCSSCWPLIEGALIAAPRAAGGGFSRVTCLSNGRRARFEIETSPCPAPALDARRLATLANNSDAVFMETDSDGVILFVSPSSERIMGLHPDQLVGHHFERIAQPAKREYARRLDEHIRKTDEPFHVEWPFHHPDGRERYYAFTSRVFRPETGERHRVAVIRDVTAVREMQRVKEERAALLERVARATPDAMLVIDTEIGQITKLTDGDLTWLGLPADVFEGRSAVSLDQLVHPDDLPALAAHRQRTMALAAGEVSQLEMRVRQPDGSWRWLRLRDVVFSSRPDGTPKELLVCIGDVTDQRTTRAALEDSEERYRRISELASDYSFCIRVDPDGTVEREWITDAFFRISGYTNEESPPQDWEQLVHPDDHETCRRNYAQAFRTGSVTFEFRMVTRTGETRWIREHSEVVTEPSGSGRWYGACRDVTEQRLAERARRLVEQRFQAIAENSWDIIGEIDSEGMPVYLSPNVRDVLGWEPEELLNSHNPDLLHPDDRPRVAEQIQKVLAGADEARMEVRCRHKQSGWRHLELTATTYVGEGGLRRGMFVSRDITEGLQIRTEHERLSSLVSASSEMIAIFESDGRLLFLNRSGRRLTGLGASAVNETRLFDLMDLSEATRVRQEALETALNERPWEGECRLHPADGGEPFPILANIFRLPDPLRAEGYKLALVARDIRSRKRAENALHESEQRFRMLVENAFDMIAEIDDDGNFVYASPRYQEVLGYDPKALTGQRVLDLLHEDERDHIEQLVDSNEDVSSLDLGPSRVRHVDGSWRWVENQVRRYTRRSGEPILIVVSRDVTGRRKTEDQLRLSQEQLLQSQKMEAIGRLAGGVAHDFNNLLTAITGYGDLLYQELGEGDPLRDDAAEILRAAEQASGLTRQLLAFSRRQVLLPRVVELNGLVSDIERLLRRLIGERVELITALGPDIGPVRVDSGQVEQLLVNLAVNARDAMPDGGRLTIATSALDLAEGMLGHPGVPLGSWITLAVTDTGEGMSDETISRIFEPFFTTKDLDKGTGLGLSMVYGIVQQSSGHIRVDSEAERGTTFTVYLPRSEQAVDSVPPTCVHADLRGNETVVLVEDEETVRRLMTRYLEEHGYRVLAASSAIEALRAVQRHEGPVDVLVTDIVLAKMDGRALAERLRRDHPGLRVLFVSGFSQEDPPTPDVVDGPLSLIQQPFSPSELLQRMRELLASG